MADVLISRDQIERALEDLKKRVEADFEFEIDLTEQGRKEGHDLDAVERVLFGHPLSTLPLLISALSQHRDDLPDASDCNTLQELLDVFEMK